MNFLRKILKKEQTKQKSAFDVINEKYYIQKRVFGSGKVTFTVYRNFYYSPPRAISEHYSSLDDATEKLEQIVKMNYDETVIDSEIINFVDANKKWI